MPLRRHARLVEEDAAEVIAVGEDLGLQRQERAARIDEVDARQAVLQRDFLRAQVLLDRERVVGAALDRGVVGDDHHVAARHAADAGDDAGRRRVVVVHVPRRQRRELEERRARIEQRVDALAHRQLALLAVAREVLRAAALLRLRQPLAVFGDERLHAVAVGAELGGRRCRCASRESGSITAARLPAAAVGLEAARRAAPDGVHAVHLGAAALALHGVLLREHGGQVFAGFGGAAGRKRPA